MLIRVNVDNPADKITEFGAGAKLYWARDDASAGGTFTAAAGSTVLDAAATQYEIVDSTGAEGAYYRSRIGNAAGTSFDPWSDVFQAGAPEAYGSLDALRELLQLPDSSRDNLLSDTLRRVSVRINSALGFDFWRHPAVSGTETRTLDVPRTGMDYIHYVPGIQSLTSVETAYYTGGAYSVVTAGGYALRDQAVDGGPFLRLYLTGSSAPAYLSYGFETLRLTGVFGYPEVPADIEQATLHWAADLYRVGASGGVASVGVGLDDFGQPRFLGGMPRITWETVEEYRKRHHGVLAR